MTDNVDFPIIKKAKTCTAGDLGVDFGSRQPEDYVGVLNRTAKAIGAVPNMGIYADITAIRGYNMLKVDTRDHYLDIDTEMVETPRKVKTNRRNVTSVATADLDIFVGDDGDTVEGILDDTIENHACEPTVACDKCHGNGKCKACNGNGRSTQCKGSGKQRCPRCEGSGWYQTYLTYKWSKNTSGDGTPTDALPARRGSVHCVVMRQRRCAAAGASALTLLHTDAIRWG